MKMSNEIELAYGQAVRLAREISSSVRHEMSLFPNKPMSQIVSEYLHQYSLSFATEGDRASVADKVWQLLDEYTRPEAKP